MSDITDVVMYAYEFSKTTFWSFNLFGVHWDMTFLQIWLIPCIAGLTIKIVKHIYDLATM
ncbi:MAG: hypothetical protein J6S67_00065 [Methanobrevibacter sp.]|nr:hypothetical protein [Methanobrevibacter sp.]